MRHLRAGINDDTKTTVQNILSRLCRIILDKGYAANAANDKYLGYVVTTATCLGNRSLFMEACKKTLQTSNWDDNTWPTLGALIDPQTDLEADE